MVFGELFMPFSQPIAAILFDLDGTLVRLPAIWKFFDELLVETLTEFKIPIPDEKTRLDVWHTGGDFVQNIESWGVEDYDAFIHRFDVLDLEKRSAFIRSGEVHLFDDVDVLQPLHKKFKLGLLTNTPPDIALLEMKAFDIKQYFDILVMLGTVEQEIAKPEPDGFLRCLEHLCVSAEETVMVGDSSSDIIGGNRVGLITVLVERPGQPIPQKLDPPPDLIITDLHDLLKFASKTD